MLFFQDRYLCIIRYCLLLKLVHNLHHIVFQSCQVLDFKKIKEKERDAAKQLFKTREGKTQLKDIQRKAKTFVPGTPLPEATNKNTNAAGLTPEQVRSDEEE